MAITYTKLKSGDWGLRATGETLTAGQRVTVTKASGESKLETVGKVLWNNNGTTIATIYRQPKAVSSGRSSRRLSDDDRCEVCNGNKFTCGHCVGWMLGFLIVPLLEIVLSR